jgi:hypothetical protein
VHFFRVWKRCVICATAGLLERIGDKTNDPKEPGETTFPYPLDVFICCNNHSTKKARDKEYPLAPRQCGPRLLQLTHLVAKQPADRHQIAAHDSGGPIVTRSKFGELQRAPLTRCAFHLRAAARASKCPRHLAQGAPEGS